MIHRLVGAWQPRRAIKCGNGVVIAVPDAPQIPAIFDHPQCLSKPITFLVDTGADMTTIFPDDLDRLRIAKKALEKDCEKRMMGAGGPIMIRFLQNVSLEFIKEGRETHIVGLGRVGVLMPSRKQREQYIKTPSLLGRDFLNRCAFEFNDDKVILAYRED